MTKGMLVKIKKIFEANKMCVFVLITFIPLMLWSYVIYGTRALGLESAAIFSCLLFHILAWGVKTHILKRKGCMLFDLSPIVSAWLLAFTLPHNVSYFVLIIGCAAAIAVKELTGGFGKNILNPALAGRAFLQLVFPDSTSLMLSFETSSERSGLAAVLEGGIPERSLADMILGRVDGNLGEISVILIIIGGIFLIVNRVVNWRTPAAFLAGGALFSMLFAPDNTSYFYYILGQLFCGGMLFCALYFSSDPVTSPHTNTGRLIFGAVCGALAVIIRIFFSYEGTYLVVFFAALWVPLMDRFLRPGVFGGLKTSDSAVKKEVSSSGEEGEKT